VELTPKDARFIRERTKPCTVQFQSHLDESQERLSTHARGSETYVDAVIDKSFDAVAARAISNQLNELTPCLPSGRAAVSETRVGFFCVN